MTDCLFCKIANHELDTQLVFEDDSCVAFNDINPQAPTHILIIPKQHIATLNDLEDSALAGHIIMVATKLAKQLGVSEDGYRLNWNCNHDGGQEVYHIHLHLLAGRKFNWPPG
jgi:histidine triad (HIT) family protein